MHISAQVLATLATVYSVQNNNYEKPCIFRLKQGMKIQGFFM